MLDAVLRRLPKNAGRRPDENDDTAQPSSLVSLTDQGGRTLGVEDAQNPALVDDPAIRADAAADATTSPSLTLLDGTGLPYIDPARYGGSVLNQVSPGLGEPLNVIISALSSPDVLTRKGLQGYLRSLDFDMECFGLHSGKPQQAFLDPRGWQDEAFLYRQVYTPFDHIFGTCIESLRGGNHIRAYQQQGTAAWFFATSKEENVTKHHMIIPDGYNIGRDELVQQSQPAGKNGTTSFMFKTYKTRVEYVSGLLPPGMQGVNHNIATDGRVALLTVTLVRSDEKARSKALKRAQRETAAGTTTKTTQQQQQPMAITVSGLPAAVNENKDGATPPATATTAPSAKRRSLLRFTRKPATTPAVATTS